MTAFRKINPRFKILALINKDEKPFAGIGFLHQKL
jgi:hypothetical protein